jgi:hypothetical protein
MPMIQIDDQLISTEVFSEEFVCNLGACKGECCVAGDAGAPITIEESKIIDHEFDKFKSYLSEKGLKSIEAQGKYVLDGDGELETPLNDGAECSYTVFDNSGNAMCGIELAWKDGKTTFRKPISCHLYPIRTTQYETFEAVNYERWNICSDACTLGKELKVPVYKFTKDALIRKYGEAWYAELEKAKIELEKLEQSDGKTK